MIALLKLLNLLKLYFTCLLLFNKPNHQTDIHFCLTISITVKPHLTTIPKLQPLHYYDHNLKRHDLEKKFRCPINVFSFFLRHNFQ